MRDSEIIMYSRSIKVKLLAVCMSRCTRMHLIGHKILVQATLLLNFIRCVASLRAVGIRAEALPPRSYTYHSTYTYTGNPVLFILRARCWDRTKHRTGHLLTPAISFDDIYIVEITLRYYSRLPRVRVMRIRSTALGAKLDFQSLSYVFHNAELGVYETCTFSP